MWKTRGPFTSITWENFAVLWIVWICSNMIHIVLSWHKMLLKQRAKYIDDTIVFYPDQSQKSAQNSERVQNIFSLTNLKLLFETMKRHILQWPIPVVVVVLKTIRLSRLVNTSNLDSDIHLCIIFGSKSIPPGKIANSGNLLQLWGMTEKCLPGKIDCCKLLSLPTTPWREVY